MSVGQTISRTFGVVKDRFGILLGLWAAFFGIQIVLFIVLGGVMGPSGAMGLMTGDATGFGVGTVLSLIVFYLVYFMISFASIAAMVAAASPLQRLGFGEAFSAGFRSSPTLLGVFVLFMIGYIVLALVVGVLAGLLSMAGSAGMIVLVLLVVPGAIYLLCRLSMVNSVAAVENVRNPIAVIGRSWRMTSGKVFVIFATLFLFFVAAIALLLLMLAPVYSTITFVAETGAVPGFGSLGLAFVGLLVIGVLISIVMAAMLAVVHGAISGHSAEEMSTVFA